MRRLLAFLAFLSLSPGPAAAAPTPFAGIFEISHDGAGHLTQFDAVGVVDARTGRSKPEPIAFPRAYINAARAYVETHLKPETPRHYFTFFPFDPDHPTDLQTPKD